MNTRERFHFIGIGGVGMSGLARLLLKGNVEVSGSDLSANYITEKLAKEGAKITIGHAPQNVEQGMSVVYTTGINENNPEYVAALNYLCPLYHRSDLLLRLMEGHQTLAVAGTHGKTTTSALLTSVLTHADVDPTFAVGGTLLGFQSNAGKGSGSYFVAEACESDGSFTKYNPYGGIVTNVDCDHMDFFGTEKNLLNSFRQFIDKVSHSECFFWCGDNERLRSIANKGFSYGYGESCDLKVVCGRQDGWMQVFDVNFQGKLYADIQIPLVGHHNVLNAAAVFGLCLQLGITEEKIRNGLIAFQGVGRRCEKKANVHDVLVIDDYAHHPVEIKTTLHGIRKAIGERKLIAVFQPHRYTRTKDCLGTFAAAFVDADEVIVTDIYSAQELALSGVTSQIVAHEIASNFRIKARYVPRESLTKVIAESSRPHDVVVGLGAGDITHLGADLLEQWSVEPPKKWRVGVVFGGRSVEHEISLLSARHVVDSLDSNLYDVNLFCIDKEGRWNCCDAFFKAFDSPVNDMGVFSFDVLQALQACDLFFPVLHGPYGEDGTIQGFFEMLNKPYVGCDHRSAAICMDKALTKTLAAAEGILVVPFVKISEGEWLKHSDLLLERIENNLRYPLFVKPLHLGSTVGVAKVTSPDRLNEAIEAGFKVDTDLLVENGMTIREIEFAVLGNEFPRTFPPGEILADGKIYDYVRKYGEDDPIKAVPCADLSEEQILLGMELAKKAYVAAGCKGMARVDFFFDQEGNFWLNEINPIPGFTKISLYPQICSSHGVPSHALVQQLIVLALQRKRQLQRSLENV